MNKQLNNEIIRISQQVTVLSILSQTCTSAETAIHVHVCVTRVSQTL